MPSTAQRAPLLPRILVLVPTVLLGASGLVSSGHIFTRAYLGMSQRNLTVAQVTPGGPADSAGLVTGDRILAVDGISAAATSECAQRLRGLRVGQSATLLIAAKRDRTPGPDPAGTRLVVIQGAAPPWNEVAWRFTFAAAGLCALAVGFFLAYQRPEKLTLVFFGICFAIGFFLREQPIFASPALDRAHEMLYILFELLLPAFFIHFFLLFPARPPSPRRHVLERLIYVPPIAIALLTLVMNSWPTTDATLSVRRASIQLLVTTLYFISSAAIAVVLFVRSFHRTRDPRQRAPLRVAVWGTALGMAPLLLATTLANLFPASDLPGLRYSIFALLLIPFSFAYAAFRYQVFDLEVLVKRSVLYSGLTGLVLALYFGVVLGLGGLLHRVTGTRNPFLAIVSIVVIAFVAAPAREKLQQLIERVFFRERYDARLTLRRFSHDLARMLELGGIATLLVERVMQVLELETAALLLARTPGAPFEPLHVAPPAEDGMPALSAHITHLFAAGTHGDRENRNDHGWSRSEDGTRSLAVRLAGPGSETALELLLYDDRRSLQAYRPAVAVPLWGRERLLGALLLGAPLSGGWSNQEDLDLLETLGEQASVALENALLHRTALERERMAQELAVARDIQTHLVPRAEPECDAIDFAGSTTPSHEIGGDFYDYVPLDGRQLGLAIGDVSGKGIPAALLMAGLQSSFRMEAERGASPAGVLAALNHRIYALGEYDRFVCFFYGLLDLASHQITYANAGLDPPILIRATGKVERLSRGGPVLGVVPGASFDQGKVTLASGDTLILFTDGLVEPAEIVSGFGEEDLISFLIAHRNESATRLRELTLARLIDLAGDMSMDDTTLIIARAR